MADHEITPDSLMKALDDALAETNTAYLQDAALQERDMVAGDSWRRLWEAEMAVGSSGVVLPIALAQDLQRLLNLDDTVIPAHLLVAMLDYHIARAATRVDK